jgi:hypothetical protein
MMRTAHFLPILLVLTSCNARWQSLDSIPPAATEAAELHDFRGTGRAQGHRDFPRDFDGVWQATIQTLHARGVGVPKSVQPEEQRVHMDLDALQLLVEQRAEGRVCVLIRFRELDEENGVQESLKFLDEVHARLLGR